MGLKSCCRKGPIAAFMVLILFCGCREDLIARIQSGARYSAAHREESSKEFKGIKSLIVSEVAGTIGIQFEKGDLATVNATKVIHAATKDTAKKHADDLNVRFEIDGETLKVFAEYPGDIRKLEFDGYVSYDIYLLVSCPRNSFAKSAQLGKDGVGGRRPDERM